MPSGAGRKPNGFTLTFRAMKAIHSLFPTFFGWAAASGLIKAALPLTALLFSARILNELTGARSVPFIIQNVALTVLITFALSALNALCDRNITTVRSYSWQKAFYHRSERFATLDFEYVEDTAVAELLATMDAQQNASGKGLAVIVSIIPSFIQYAFSLILSVALLGGLFVMKGGAGIGFVGSGWSNALLIASLTVPTIARIALTNWSNRVQAVGLAKNMKTNNLFNYYSDYIEPRQAAKDLRIFHQQNVLVPIMHKPMILELIKAYGSTMTVTNGTSGLANALVGLLAYLIIGLRALSGMYSLGQVTQYVGAVAALCAGLNALVASCMNLWENNQYLQPFFEFMDLPTRITHGDKAIAVQPDARYELEFHDVSFRYPKTEAWALRHLNLKLRPDQKLAVVGRNGSGKTTMIKLLCRMYDPTEGRITLNGVDIREYNLHQYRELFGVVFQDFHIMSLSVGENVAAGQTYDAVRIEECIKAAGFGERYAKMPRGLDSPLYKDYDEDGATISGGEAQKLALARALYRNAPIIVLDEPTAALDPIAEFEVYSHFDQLIGGKTSVYISHRLSSCRFCDIIAVFNAGELVQYGTHDALVNVAGGLYATLWQSQAQYYAEAPDNAPPTDWESAPLNA